MPPVETTVARPLAGCWSPGPRDFWAGPWPRLWRGRGTTCGAGRALRRRERRRAWVGYGEVGPDTRWDEALAGIDVVVHLAGLAHLPDETAAAAADTFARVNAEGTARLAAAAVRLQACAASYS